MAICESEVLAQNHPAEVTVVEAEVVEGMEVEAGVVEDSVVALPAIVVVWGLAVVSDDMDLRHILAEAAPDL